MDERISHERMMASTGTATDFSPEEVDLLLTAVGHLEATLGREEADELERVQALKRKLQALRGR
jgi:hypothetical protein